LYCFDNTRTNVTTFHYGGPGFSVVDTEIFRKDSLLWEFENWSNTEKENVFVMDDLYLSWIVSRLPEWYINRTFVVPQVLLKAKHPTSKHLTISGVKGQFLQTLNNISPFVPPAGSKK
jgi:hypothetical protein